MEFSGSNLSVLRQRVEERAAELGVDQQGYLQLLRDQEREWRVLETRVTNNESYLFRDETALDWVNARIGMAESPVRIWSAGCARGEELTTLWLKISGSGWAEKVEEMVGTDLDLQMIRLAQAGEFPKNSLRKMEASEIERFFESVRPGWFRLRSAYQSAAKFYRGNLLDSRACRSLGVFDYILCRNVLMYFRDEAIEKAVEHLGRALSQGGVLVTTACESLAGRTGLVGKREGRVSYYQRR